VAIYLEFAWEVPRLFCFVETLFPQSIPNLTQDRFKIVKHGIIPESQNPITLCVKVCRSLSIINFLLKMLTAVQFDNQFLARGTEIHNVVSDGMLVAEMNVAQAMSA
jgi:hypothetical protein